jgi:hypothetical protein
LGNKDVKHRGHFRPGRYFCGAAASTLEHEVQTMM